MFVSEQFSEGREVQRVEKECFVWISILSHKIKKHMNAKMHSLGLTGTQSAIMHFILVKCSEGPVFQRDVEGAFEMNRSTATGILQLMEKNGLISRESVASDARLKSLVPTEKAALLDAKIGEYLCLTEQSITQGLTKDQIRAFLDTAEHMSANLDG